MSNSAGTPGPTAQPRERVPVRTILATVGIVLATLLTLLLIQATAQVLVWIVIALFFSVPLYPAVNWTQRYLRRRSVATLVVFLLLLLFFAGIIAAFAIPLAREGTTLVNQLPRQIQDARTGRGPLGALLQRTHALDYVQQHQDKISQFVTGLTTPALGLVQSAVTGIAGVLTIFVLTYLMVLQGPVLVEGGLNLLDESKANRVRRVSADCARTITGYITGNLLISLLCGLLTFGVLQVLGVPFAGLLGLFVGITDLIPMVGATLGAVVALLAALLHSVPAAVIVLVFFIVYQQLENHLLQPLIFSRTVKLNPLAVLLAVLVAADLGGILGALLAIPLAGMLQVIVRDVWDYRTGRPKPEPTVGPDQTPVTKAEPAVPASMA